MRLSLGLFFLLLTFPTLAATTVTTRISSIDPGDSSADDTLLLLSTGQVAKLRPDQKKIREELEASYRKGSWIELALDENRYVRAQKTTSTPLAPRLPEAHFKELQNYTPSVIESPEAAQLLFAEARIKHKDSQCYNRAHIWTYEWRVKHRLYTSKAWLFFTRKYIRKFNFEWWFHVAPYFHVLENGQVWEKVADAKYARGPIKLKTWTDIFLRNDAHCPVVSSYSDWANYPESGWCFVMKTSMYYYQPVDMEALEKDGVERNLWDPGEIRGAYKEAFDIDV